MGNYLITGGAGFVGSHTVEHLLAAGHRVAVVDDFSTGRRENLPTHSGLTVIETDLRTISSEQLSERFDGLVHLAALPSVNDSWTELRRAHELNLSATVQVLELARALRVPKMIFASSAAVYGNPTRVPIDENDAVLPLSPYGLQKLASEHYGRLLAREGEITFVALRFFNIFGPRQVASSPYSGVISKFAAAFRAGGPVAINGGGAQTRDFVYVADIARAIGQALAASNLAPFTVCNLGTGRAITIRELAETMRGFFPEWNATFESAPAPPGDIVYSQASIAAAERLLAYRPENSLEAGLAAMLATAE